jgi:hypothetical protein
VQAERFSVTITTDGSGNGVGRTPGFTGKVLAIIYQKPVSGGYDNNVTLAAALELSGEAVLALAAAAMDASGIWYPRKPISKAADGTGVGATSVEAVAGACDRLVLTIAAGGDTKVGTFLVVVG